MATKNQITPKKAKKIFTIDFSENMVFDTKLLQEMRENIANSNGYIIKNVVSPKLIDDIVKYLESVASNSLPAWYPLVNGCPDFYRINNFDKRSYVQAKMLQFNFHPWNQNMFDLFEKMKHIYYLKNQLSGIEHDAFLENIPADGHISRLAFQFYPQGGGCIKMHADPVGKHQVSVPVLMMSDKGKDYHQGGGSVINENDELVDVDSLMKKGDVVFFNAEVIHGVKPIDPEKDCNWLDFKGRWIMIASVIKTLANDETPNSLQIEE